MSLQNAITAAKAIESLENYAVSDVIDDTLTGTEKSDSNRFHVHSDQEFWTRVLNGSGNWGARFAMNNVVLSEHIARVPGLYFHTDPADHQSIDHSLIEYVSGKWIHYTPQGKSQKVLSGAGTLKLPPTTNGWRVASVSFGSNASLGIPVLISEEAWKWHKCKEGKMISRLEANWVEMDTSWAARFPSIRGIPKGYLKVDSPSRLKVEEGIYPTLYHPFSIMEYEDAGGLFYDFVYVTVASTDPNSRDDIRTFLGEYQYHNGRFGHYLIDPFINDPLLNSGDALYTSPEELRRINAASESHLFLLKERIKRRVFNDFTLERIKEFIDNHLDVEDLKVCSSEIIINPNIWFQGRRLVDESANFQQECMERDKVDELVDNLIKYGLNRHRL